MGQMAVRVALQCSEADAHLILSDERNMAARFLSRPGEAIYNDQNGLLGRQSAVPGRLALRVAARRVPAARSKTLPPSKAVVHAAGDRLRRRSAGRSRPRTCSLRDALGRRRRPAPPPVRKAWLGAAVAIKEPTFVNVRPPCRQQLARRRQRRRVGARRAGERGRRAGGAESAIGDRPRFFVLDGTRPDSPVAGAWQRLADALAALRSRSPARATRPASLPKSPPKLARREAAGEEDAPPLYLVIYDGGRFRDLRRGEDDFSFSIDRDKPPRPDKQWAEILRNGPAWGVHSLVWCDSYNNVNRLVDRQTLREFEMRVLFQMSAADSTNLLDTPGRQPAPPTPRPVLQRRPRHAGKIPPLRPAERRMAGPSSAQALAIVTVVSAERAAISIAMRSPARGTLIAPPPASRRCRSSTSSTRSRPGRSVARARRAVSAENCVGRACLANGVVAASTMPLRL